MISGSLAQSIAQIQTYRALVWKHRWQILVGTLAMMFISTIIIAKLPNVYEVTTTILVDPQQIPEKYVSAAFTADPYSRLNTITQQVLSRTRLQEIIDKINLYPYLRRSASAEELIARMRDDITIQVKQGAGPELSTFTITYRGKQPAVVAEVANQLAASFIEWNVNTREEQVAGTKEFLTTELENAKSSLEEQEDKLRQFKMEHLGETPDQAPNNLQALAGLRSTLQASVDSMNRLDEERALLTSFPESPASVLDHDVILSARGSLELEKKQLEGKLRDLRERYSDSYPDVIAANHRLEIVNGQLESLPPDGAQGVQSGADKPTAARVRLELIDKDMKRLRAQQDQIQAQIAGYQAKLNAAPLREQQLVELNRNYDISKENYQALLNKSFSIDMASDLEQKQKGERFTVLDRALVPEKPASPNRKTLIPLFSLGALGLSIFLVIAKETLSPAIQTEQELKSILPNGVRLEGLIPRIEIAADARRERLLAISASLVSIVIFVAIVGVIWRIRFTL